MLNKIDEKTYKGTYIEYPDAYLVTINNKGECSINWSVMFKPYKFNITKLDDNLKYLKHIVCQEIISDLQNLKQEYVEVQ